MNDDRSPELNKEDACIYRIMHMGNLPWVLKNGLWSPSSPQKAEKWVSIGHTELINKRKTRVVPTTGGFLSNYIPFYFTPHSVMLYTIHKGFGSPTNYWHNDPSDYSVRYVPNDEIVILVASLRDIAGKVPYTFTDGHAYANETKFYTELNDLDHIGWDILKQRDFSCYQEGISDFKDYLDNLTPIDRSLPDEDKVDGYLSQLQETKRDQVDVNKLKRYLADLSKRRRYQAEALIQEHLPVRLLREIVCYNEEAEKIVKEQIKKHNEQNLSIPVSHNPKWYF